MPPGWMPVAETWRRVWGDEKFFSLTKISEWRFFGENFHFNGKNFWWPFFSHRPGFPNFAFLFSGCPYLYYVKCRIWPFPHKKNTFFYSVHTLARIRQHSSKFLGDGCMGRPPAP